MTFVWLYTDHSNPNLNRKFQSFWSGPYKEVKQNSNTIFEIESYGRWSKNKIVTSAAVDRLKKCYVTDPETNLGVPVELTATDVRPYFEHQDLLGRLPASEFAPHIFDREQELPFSLPPDQPRDEKPILPQGLEEPPRPKEIPTPMTEPVPEASDLTSTPTSAPDLPTIEDPAPEPEPFVSKRGRGRPPGSKNKPKVCPNCTLFHSMCNSLHELQRRASL